jgi:hypothetical protein
MTFKFSEKDMIIALLANGWTNGWTGSDWIAPGMNADFGGYNLKEAFSRLLYSKNLVPVNTTSFWSVE